ncbi:MAG TPA: riboflavin synthase [Actinomycetota bacterium]|nr:riboflavin synthase [Actinomycetota bacterium]
MFTGIVEERGRVLALEEGHLRIAAKSLAEDAELGDSISVSGVCLTVADREGEELSFDLADETLSRTTLGDLREGDEVNLERPVTLLTPLGGHLVQGHVDGVGEVIEMSPGGQGARMSLRLPEGLSGQVVEKGSIAVDGVSLTIASVEGDEVEIALVPHTMAVTTLGDRNSGSRVNLETDVLAKYVERMMRRDS